MPRTLKPILGPLLFFLTFSALAVSQQYTIQRADYGYGTLRVDVTQRLRDLARANATFRMGNNTFGVDPAPGRVKTLRIFTTGPGGRPRTFEYREGSIVDGSQFSGWGGGNWGNRPQYQILGARYGTAQGNVDVTARLQQLARSNSFFRLGNSTFGVDPAPGVVKTLRIWTRAPNGGEKLFEYREGSMVDGSQFSGWGGGNWGNPGWSGGWWGSGGPPPGARPPARPPVASQLTIIRATYGAPGRNQDVSARLRSLIRGNTLNIRVNNDTMGTDPAPGVPKTLSVSYAMGRGAQQQRTVPENGQLVLP
jgi:hypothetical protein